MVTCIMSLSNIFTKMNFVPTGTGLEACRLSACMEKKATGGLFNPWDSWSIKTMELLYGYKIITERQGRWYNKEWEKAGS